MFEEEPKLPLDGESLYVNGYVKKNAEAMLKKWTNAYGNGKPFHEMKYRDFKRSLDQFFGAPRHALRFNLWDYITEHYLFHNHIKLKDDEIAYIQSRRNDITSRIDNGVKIINKLRRRRPNVLARAVRLDLETTT